MTSLPPEPRPRRAGFTPDADRARPRSARHSLDPLNEAAGRPAPVGAPMPGGPSTDRPGGPDGRWDDGWPAPADGPDTPVPFYPAQRRREDTWPPTRPMAGPVPLPGPMPRLGPTAVEPPMPVVPPAAPAAPAGSSSSASSVAPLPPAPPAPPVTPAPLPRTGEEPLATLAAPAEPDPEVAEGWALVTATQQGDTEAFGRLFDRYHDVVFRFVLYRLGDKPLAEDLTQETFVRAYRRIGSVSYQGRDIGAWFVTIARNLVLDHVKSSRYRLETATPEITDVAPDVGSPGPENAVIAGATHEELLRCVARLGPDQQECVTLRFLQGMSVTETAQIMGRNEGAVKALQHRAVRRLHQLLPEGLR